MPLSQGFRTLLACALLMLAAQGASAAGLEARLDRNQMGEGEVVQLMLRTDRQSSGNPDLSPLQQDFEIVNRGQSSRFEFSNGNARSWREWQIALVPKRTGELTIPSINVGTLSSEPVELKVLPAGQTTQSNDPSKPVMLEVESTPHEPYVQGKVIYSVRLLLKTPLRRANLTDPQVADAIVERLGDERRYETYRNGQNYRVIERRYAIFPQRSGTLEIAPPVLSAHVPLPNQQGNGVRDRVFGGRDPFAQFDQFFGKSPFSDMGSAFEQTRPIRLRGEKQTLNVLPQPAGTPTPWLPAESVTLNEAWSPNPPEFRVGEPVTRSIAITAQGVTAAQLPDLSPQAGQGVTVYPDKPQTETRADGDTLIAQKIVKSALVPSKSGKLSLPPVELKWWDVNNNTLRVAQLPGRDIDVLPGAAGETQTVDEAQAGSISPQAAAAPTTAPAVANDTDTVPGRDGNNATASRSADWRSGYWPWIALLFAVAWAVSMFLWWRSRRDNGGAGGSLSQAATAKPSVMSSSAGLLKQVEKACQANDAKATRQALLTWAAAVWSDDPPQGLETLAQRLPPPAGPVLEELNRNLYAGEAARWNGPAAWQALASLLRDQAEKGTRRSSDSALPPLYAN